MEQKNGNYRKYTSKNPMMRHVINSFLDEVSSIVSSADVGTVLDMGCGEGFVAGRLGDKRLVGVDISKRALALARENSPCAELACGHIYRMPFKAESFDMVMGMEVLEHLDEPEKALEEAGRLSRRYCLFSVPHVPYFMAMNLMRGKNVSRLGNDPEHIHNWTDKGFIDLISRYYAVVDVRKPFPWVMVLCEKKAGMVYGDD